VGDPDPYPLWHSTQAEGGGQNYSGWDNPEADQIMEQARAIVDPEARKQLYWQFQDIFADELPALPLYYPVYTYGVSDKVYNVQMGSINQPSERFKTFADWYMVTKRVPANQAADLAPPAPPGATPASE
jgi:peptide/nickel transport system substrate-binding protein